MCFLIYPCHRYKESIITFFISMIRVCYNIIRDILLHEIYLKIDSIISVGSCSYNYYIL